MQGWSFRRKSVLFLLSLNLVLIAVTWIMALSAYPKIPNPMGARLALFGWEFGPRTRSPLFFVGPLFQTVVYLLISVTVRLATARSRRPERAALREEDLQLAMIFVNAIFIHLQRNMIGLAVLGQKTLNSVYLLGLVAIVILVGFYDRLRTQALGPKSPPPQ